MQNTSPSPDPSPVQSQFLKDDSVLVLTKARFFRTLNILLDYAQHPERRTWEFFSYRPWDYILCTYSLTFDLDEWAISCGPQHPCLSLRPLPRLPGPAPAVKQARLKYAQPDFALMSNAFKKEGEILFLGEAKPMGPVEPDTVEARELALVIFLEVEVQRQRQARLAFERHSESHTINILMICGSFWSVWSYKRSAILPDSPPPSPQRLGEDAEGQQPPSPSGSDERNSPDPDRSPPTKIRRTDQTRKSGRYFRDARFSFHSNQDHDPSGSDFSPVPSPPSDRADRTWRPNPEEEPLDCDIEWDYGPPKDGKATKKGKNLAPGPQADTTASPQVAVHHVLQLPNKDALNPWFRRFLTKTRDTLVGQVDKKGTVQSSWFDWTEEEDPEGDGHSPGYVLPKAKSSSVDVVDCEIVEVVRADAPPEMAGVVLSPSSQIAANAMLSPMLSLSGYFGPAGNNRTPVPVQRFEFSVAEEDTVLPQAPEATSPDEESDTAPSPTPEQRRLIPLPQRSQDREASPIELYMERKGQGPSRPQADTTPSSSSSSSAQPLPRQPPNDLASRPSRATLSVGTRGDGASAEPPKNRAPPAASTSTNPSPAVASGSRLSTTDPRVHDVVVNPSKSHAAAEATARAAAEATALAAAEATARADAEATVRADAEATALADARADAVIAEHAAARAGAALASRIASERVARNAARVAESIRQQRRELIRYKKSTGQYRALPVREGPQLHLWRLPNRKPLPDGFEDIPFAEQQLLVLLEMPRGKDRKKALLRSGMPEYQVREMVERFPSLAGRPATTTQAAGPSTDTAGSSAHVGGSIQIAGVQHAAASSSRTVAAAATMPPPPLPTTMPTPTPATLSGSAEGGPRRGGSNTAQNVRPPPPSLRAGPSTTTGSATSTTLAGSRDRTSAGTTSSSSRSAAVRANDVGDNSTNDRGHSSAARSSQQASNRPQPQRRRDPVAATTDRLQTLHIESRPPDPDPDRREGSSKRKGKDR